MTILKKRIASESGTTKLESLLSPADQQVILRYINPSGNFCVRLVCCLPRQFCLYRYLGQKLTRQVPEKRVFNNKEETYQYVPGLSRSVRVARLHSGETVLIVLGPGINPAYKEKHYISKCAVRSQSGHLRSIAKQRNLSQGVVKLGPNFFSKPAQVYRLSDDGTLIEGEKVTAIIGDPDSIGNLYFIYKRLGLSLSPPQESGDKSTLFVELVSNAPPWTIYNSRNDPDINQINKDYKREKKISKSEERLAYFDGYTADSELKSDSELEPEPAKTQKKLLLKRRKDSAKILRKKLLADKVKNASHSLVDDSRFLLSKGLYSLYDPEDFYEERDGTVVRRFYSSVYPLEDGPHASCSRDIRFSLGHRLLNIVGIHEKGISRRKDISLLSSRLHNIFDDPMARIRYQLIVSLLLFSDNTGSLSSICDSWDTPLPISIALYEDPSPSDHQIRSMWLLLEPLVRDCLESDLVLSICEEDGSFSIRSKDEHADDSHVKTSLFFVILRIMDIKTQPGYIPNSLADIMHKRVELEHKLRRLFPEESFSDLLCSLTTLTFTDSTRWRRISFL